MFRIPVPGEDDLLWGYFVLQAAMGSPRVPDWTLVAAPELVARRLGVDGSTVGADEVDAALALLPEEPAYVLSRLLRDADVKLPAVDDGVRLSDAAVRGTFRTPVDQRDVLHDAALLVRRHYGAEHFYACVDRLDAPYDAVAAVAAMMYLLVLVHG